MMISGDDDALWEITEQNPCSFREQPLAWSIDLIPIMIMDSQ
jgi:hypothetical protein